jgi:hypothetical protein
MGKIIIIAISIVLIACGGGGSNNGISSVVQSSSQAVTDPTANPISATITSVSRENTPYLAYALLDTLDFTKNYPQDLREVLSDISLLKVGETTGECQNKNSKYTLELNSTRSKIIEIYTQCDFGTGSIIDGVKSTEIIYGVEEDHIIQIFDKVKFRSVLNSEEFDEFDGKMEFFGKLNEFNLTEKKFSVLLDVSVTTQEEGTLKIDDAEFVLGIRSDGGLFSGVSKMSGKAEWVGQGGFKFDFDNETSSVQLTGSTVSTGRVSYEKGIFINWDEDGDGQGEAQLFTERSLSDLLTSQTRQIIKTGYPEYKLDQPELYFARGNNISIDISKAYTNTTLSLLDYSIRVDGDINPNGNWIQTGLGKFQISFPNNTEDRFYDLVFVIKDTQNTVFEIPTKLFVGSDFDGDSVPDMYDQDDDNDSAKDENDLYPFDVSESADTDNDGLPDNKDSDADNDGVPNFVDYSPLDSTNCISENTTTCYLYYYIEPKILDENGILYFEPFSSNYGVYQAWSFIYRFNVNTQEYLAPVPISTDINIKYALMNNKFYFVYRVYGETPTYSLISMDIENLNQLNLFETDKAFFINYVEPTHIVISKYLSRATTDFYAESYTLSGQLISTIPIYGEDSRDQRRVFVPNSVENCEEVITTTTEGFLYLYKDYESPNNCYSGPVSKKSLNSQYIYYNKNIHLAQDNSLFLSLPDHQYFEWISDKFFLIQNEAVKLFDLSGNSLQEFVIPEGETFYKALTNSSTVVLVTREYNKGKTHIRTFDSNFILSKEIQY